MLEGAQKDYITGFYTRESLDKFLQNLVLDSKMNKEVFSIALVDIDRFKKINDKFGHAFGDEILKYAASTLRLTLYETECHLFRYGGDEFVIILRGKGQDELFHLLRRCNYNVRHRAFLLDSRLLTITISCGIAGFPKDARTAEALIDKADKAMYFSKRHGFNLTTMAGKIRYIQLRNIFVLICGIAIIIYSLYMLYQQTFFKEIIQSVANQASRIKVVTKTDQGSDVVILKDGTVYEGRILIKDKDKVTINVRMGDGEGTLTIPASKVAQTKYSAETSSRK